MPNETEQARELRYGLGGVLHPFWGPALNPHLMKPLETVG